MHSFAPFSRNPVCRGWRDILIWQGFSNLKFFVKNRWTVCWFCKKKIAKSARILLNFCEILTIFFGILPKCSSSRGGKLQPRFRAIPDVQQFLRLPILSGWSAISATNFAQPVRRPLSVTSVSRTAWISCALTTQAASRSTDRRTRIAWTPAHRGALEACRLSTTGTSRWSAFRDLSEARFRVYQRRHLQKKLVTVFPTLNYWLYIIPGCSHLSKRL